MPGRRRGYLKERSPGRWLIGVSAGIDPVTGKRVQHWKTVPGSREDAERALTRMLSDLDQGLLANPDKATVADFLALWLQHKRPRVRPRTYGRYEGIVRVHLSPGLGKVRLSRLTDIRIQAFEDDLVIGRRTGSPVKARTALHVHRVLHTALEFAVARRLISRNPADNVEPPRPSRPLLPVVGPDVAERVLRGVRGHPLEVPVVIALGTGMRLGEILGLSWDDVDLEAGVIHVRWALQSGEGGLMLVEPKSEASRRNVSLPAFAIRTLKRHKAEQAERQLLLGAAWFDEPIPAFGESHSAIQRRFVIERGDGTPIKPETLSRRWRSFNDAAQLPRMRFHDLRHAHATLMLSKGIHPKVVSERLGHSSIRITIDTYSDVVPALQSEAARVLDELFPGAGG